MTDRSRNKSSEDKYEKYRRRLNQEGMVRISAFVPEVDRERALKYLSRLRDAARRVA
jgi:hypothetical protein